MKAKMGDNIDFILWTGYVLIFIYSSIINAIYQTANKNDNEDDNDGYTVPNKVDRTNIQGHSTNLI